MAATGVPTDETAEPRPRSSSESTPRPTPLPHPRNVPAAHDVNANVLRATQTASEFYSASSKRLPLFGDGKALGTHSQQQQPAVAQKVPIPPQLLPPRTHSRAESALALSREPSVPRLRSVASSNALTPSKLNPSSANLKASSGRTYDAKLVSREMHRLGNLAHLPAALGPALSAAASATSLTLPQPSGSSAASIATSTSGENPWNTLNVHVLPLFVGEPLRIPIEDLNALVKKHIEAVLQSPSKALATLEHNTSEFIESGMANLNAKVSGVEEEKLVSRVVEIWGFFWDQVLPYVEGVLLPLQTSPLLSSLYRTPKAHRGSSPSRQTTKSSMSSMSSLQMSPYHIDVRTLAINAFRDNVILPLSPRLMKRITVLNRQESTLDSVSYQQPRLQQMLLVLASQGRRRPFSGSLTTPAPDPTPGETAIAELLRAVRSPQPSGLLAGVRKSRVGGMAMDRRAPGFLSGSQPRDRRGRIAHKSKGAATQGVDEGESDDFGDGITTPRNGYSGVTLTDANRDMEREFLEALRSPVVETPQNKGGWGLGAGNEDQTKAAEEDDEEESLNWDQAQATVERMVGMQPPEPGRRS